MKPIAVFCAVWCCGMLQGPVAAGETSMRDEIIREFESPSNAHRGKPFWSWNGELEQEELFRQIHVLEEMGFGGFFMHSRTGLATEYLGEKWFDLVNACADEGKRLGMETWLYDEDRWPSGTAGGMVTRTPEYRMKFLRCTPIPAGEFAWSDGMVAAFACNLDGVDYSRCARIGRDTPPTEYEGRTILVFTTEEMEKSSFYNGYTYLDTLNREGTSHFIELTHEKYKQECGGRLGDSILGIFTDEPHRGPLMNNFSISNPDPDWLVPWTYAIFDEFEKRFGYDLVPHLPELFLKPRGEAVSPVKWQYVELLQQLFLENWAEPLDEWCRANGIILTGHILHEDALSCQTAVSGSMMRYYPHMEYPGIDLLTEGNRCYWVVKQLSSAARQTGQKWLLSELYGCTGWQMPFEGHKAVGDWQALFGINVRCHHLAWYTMAGEAKRDYPASIFFQSAWWRDYTHVEDYFSRINVFMTQGEPVCDLLVLNPVESLWCQVHPGWANGLSARAEPLQRLENAYRELFHALAGAQFDFDYGDEGLLPGMAEVLHGEPPVLRVGEMRYHTVVVPHMTTMRGTTADLLERLLDAGGRVIFTSVPAYVDAKPSQRCAELAEHTNAIRAAIDELAKACAPLAARPIQVCESGTGQPVSDVFVQSRQVGGARHFMALNVNREEGFDAVTVRIEGEGHVEEWDAETGERYAVHAEAREGALEFTTGFAPADEKLYVLLKEPTPGLESRRELETVKTVALEGPYDYTLSESNVCVLDFAQLHLPGEEGWQPAREILKVDRLVREHFDVPHRKGDMLQPWFTKMQGYKTLGRVALRFVFHIDELPGETVYIAMETPDRFETTVNGSPVLSSTVDGWWVDPAFQRMPVPAGALTDGQNEVVIGCNFDEGINLEALYLLGRFGVRLDGRTAVLTAMPEQVAPGDLVAQGFPFYSGAITYHVPVEKTSGRAFVVTPDFEGACVKVGSEGCAARVIGWRPYEAEVTGDLQRNARLDIEVVLTRRNSFGPLHQVPLRAGAYGPGNFVTGGDGWSDDYMLYPAGLLAPPRLELRASR